MKKEPLGIHFLKGGPYREATLWPFLRTDLLNNRSCSGCMQRENCIIMHFGPKCPSVCMVSNWAEWHSYIDYRCFGVYLVTTYEL